MSIGISLCLNNDQINALTNQLNDNVSFIYKGTARFQKKFVWFNNFIFKYMCF